MSKILESTRNEFVNPVLSWVFAPAMQSMDSASRLGKLNVLQTSTRMSYSKDEHPIRRLITTRQSFEKRGLTVICFARLVHAN